MVLMTAKANGFIKETRFELDKSGELKVYYHSQEEGATTINNISKTKKKLN